MTAEERVHSQRGLPNYRWLGWRRMVVFFEVTVKKSHGEGLQKKKSKLPLSRCISLL